MSTNPAHVEQLAAILREVDGDHAKGAAALAQAILGHPGSAWHPPDNLAAEPVGEGPSVEQVAQIVYENAMLATAPDHAKPHWPSWADLPNSDARINALNTAEIILARWGRPPAPPAPEAGEVPSEPNVKAVRSGKFLDPATWEIKP